MNDFKDEQRPAMDYAKLGTPLPLLANARQLAAGSGMLRWAHHPHCSRHDHHLVRPFGRPLCLGCTSVALGAPLGIGFACMMHWQSWAMWQWVALHLLMLAPTVVQPLIQRKTFKIVARGLLGAVSASYLISGLFQVNFFAPTWLFKISVIVAFSVLLKILLVWRNHRTSDPCSNCPLGTFPTCEWNLPRLLAANPHDSLLGQIRISDISKPPYPDRHGHIG
jgi:hypothetical protein